MYIHVSTNETHSLAYLQDLFPTLAVKIINNKKLAGLILLDVLENVFYLCMHGCKNSAEIAFA